MLAISDMDAIIAMTRIQTVMVHQITPAVPPLNRPNELAMSEDSHVACKMTTNPTIEKNRKFR